MSEDSAVESRTSIGFLPMSDRVIVEQFSEEQVTDGGIIIPDQSQEKPNMGEVVAVGEGKLIENAGVGFGRIACPFQIGHVVLFGKYAGYRFSKKVDGVQREFFALREDEILGIDLTFVRPAKPVPEIGGIVGDVTGDNVAITGAE